MSEYGNLLIRVVKGEESLAMAFWVSLALLAGIFTYSHFVPSLSDVFNFVYRFFECFFICYAVAAVHNSCFDNGIVTRLLARTWVLLLVMGGAYLVWQYYGLIWAIAFPFIAMAFTFMVKE